jgi:tetratricopeptide (TPR) repeat protein
VNAQLCLVVVAMSLATAVAPGCSAGEGGGPEAAAAPIDGAAFRDHFPARGRTTDGGVALHNLDARITQLEERRRAGGASVEDGVELVGLYQLRAQFVGRIEDDERAIALADSLVETFADDGRAYLARARTRSRYHRFDEALADVERAERLGAPGDVERGAIFEATDASDASLERLRALAASHGSFTNLSALASALARRGLHDEAEETHQRAFAAYRDVSPLMVAWLEFQHGLLHESALDFTGAGASWALAHERLPQYSAAAAHLAEIEARQGSVERAKSLFRDAYARSANPEYAGRLAAILDAADPEREAVLAEARRGFDALVERHPAAFADHAARFWLDAGADPERAFELAGANLEVRRTPEAHALMVEAALATGRVELACAHLAEVGPAAEALLGDAWAEATERCRR